MEVGVLPQANNGPDRDPGRLDASTPINTSSQVDVSTDKYWIVNIQGRRSGFRAPGGQNYKDKADYYRQSYDPLVGLRVAVTLGGLMIFICLFALNNRYGFFRKRRKVNVSLGNSQEELEGIEWLRLMGAHRRDSLEYNPASSDLDLLQRVLHQPVALHSTRQPISRMAQAPSPLDTGSRLAVSVEVVATKVPFYYNEGVFFKSNSF